MLWGWEGDSRSSDTLAVCHRLCGLSTYGLKAHIREMSTPPMLAIGHGPPLPYLRTLIALIDMLHFVYGMNSPLIFVSLVRYSLLHFTPVTHGSSSSSQSLLSPFSFSLTSSVFHSEHQTWLFGKSFPPQTSSSSTGLIHGLSNHLTFLFCSAAGFVCMD